MKMYKLRREQLVERSLSEVFSLFERPENLALISPPAMEYILFTPRPIEKKVGTLIDFSVRVFGIQLKGPYTFWHHTHRFDESSRGTLIIDDVRYVLPFGPLGRLMHTLFVKRKIDKIFDYRAQVARRTFGEIQTNT
jgi:ligand-binding SRPBCC domain-containing protein